MFVFIFFQDLYCILCLIVSSSDASDGYAYCALKKMKRERKREREHKTVYTQAMMDAKDRKFPVDLVYKLSFKFAM